MIKPHVMMRVRPRTHAIIKALAGLEGLEMVEWLDQHMVEEVDKRGFTMKEEKREPIIRADTTNMTIKIPV